MTFVVSPGSARMSNSSELFTSRKQLFRTAHWANFDLDSFPLSPRRAQMDEQVANRATQRWDFRVKAQGSVRREPATRCTYTRPNAANVGNKSTWAVQLVDVNAPAGSTPGQRPERRHAGAIPEMASPWSPIRISDSTERSAIRISRHFSSWS